MLMYIHVNVVFELLYKNIANIGLPILSATKFSHYTYSMCHCVVGGTLIKYSDSVCIIIFDLFIIIHYIPVPTYVHITCCVYVCTYVCNVSVIVCMMMVWWYFLLN